MRVSANERGGEIPVRHARDEWAAVGMKWNPRQDEALVFLPVPHPPSPKHRIIFLAFLFSWKNI